MEIEREGEACDHTGLQWRKEKLQAVAWTPQWPHPTDPANLVNLMEI